MNRVSCAAAMRLQPTGQHAPAGGLLFGESFDAGHGDATLSDSEQTRNGPQSPASTHEVTVKTTGTNYRSENVIQATDRPAATAASTEQVKRRGGKKIGARKVCKECVDKRAARKAEKAAGATGD